MLEYLMIANLMIPLNPDNSIIQQICKSDQMMAESIQFYRILNRPTWEEYQAEIKDRYKKGEPLGEAVTQDQIIIKDRFYERNLEMAEIIFDEDNRFPIGWSPEVVGKVFLEICMIEFEGLEFETILEYEV